jgi:hypothetical protein
MDDTEHDDPFASPKSEEQPKTPANQNTRFDAEAAREAALRRELEGVRNINQVIEGVIATLERSKENMSVRLPCHSLTGIRGHPLP